MSKMKHFPSNPAYIILRSAMKGKFLEALQQQPDPLKDWSDAKLVIFGSTLMRQLNEEGVDYPYPGRKSSDIDIGLHVSDPRRDFTDRYEKTVAPTLKKTCQDTKFSVIIPEMRNGNPTGNETLYTNGDIAGIPNEKFAEEFYVTKMFTRQEAEAIIRQAYPNDAEQYLPYLDCIKTMDGHFKVDLIISSSAVPTPTLLEPHTFDKQRGHQEGTLQLQRDNRLNMLAAKIVRNCLQERFKPTDIIDIYNLMHARTEAPLIDLDPASPNNRLDVLRCLIVANLAIFNVPKPWEKEDILANFDDTPENIQRFKKLTEDNVSRYGDFNDAAIGEILRDSKQLVQRIMSPRAEKGYGSLNLTEKDINFITKVSGYEMLPGLSGSRMCEPGVESSLLKQQYPTMFASYPEFATNIAHNHYLSDKMDQINERRMQL